MRHRDDGTQDSQEPTLPRKSDNNHARRFNHAARNQLNNDITTFTFAWLRAAFIITIATQIANANLLPFCHTMPAHRRIAPRCVASLTEVDDVDSYPCHPTFCIATRCTGDDRYSYFSPCPLCSGTYASQGLLEGRSGARATAGRRWARTGRGQSRSRLTGGASSQEAAERIQPRGVADSRMSAPS